MISKYYYVEYMHGNSKQHIRYYRYNGLALIFEKEITSPEGDGQSFHESTIICYIYNL